MGTLILAASILGLLFGVIYTLFKPQWAILFVIVLYPLEQLLTTASPFFANNSKVLNLLVGGLAVLGAFSGLLGGKMPFRGYFNATWFLTLVLYGIGIFGIALTPTTKNGVEQLIGGYPYLGLLLVFPALLVNNTIEFRRMAVPLMVIGSAIILLILLSPNTQMYGSRLGIESAGFGSTSKIQNPLATASLGGTIMIFGMLYKPTDNKGLVNLIRAGAIVTGLLMAHLSGSRGQLLAAIFCGVAMFPFARQIRNITQFITVAMSAFFVLVFILLVLSFATTGDVAQRWSGEAVSGGLGSRGEMAITMLQAWFADPVAIVLGLGTASFQDYWRGGDVPYVHNLIVQVLTENGIVGLAVLSAILLLVARSSWMLLRMYKDYPGELAGAAILIAYCAYQFLLSLKQGNWFTTAAPFWAFLILAKVAARSKKDMQAQLEWEAYAEAEAAFYDGASGYGRAPEPA